MDSIRELIQHHTPPAGKTLLSDYVTFLQNQLSSLPPDDRAGAIIDYRAYGTCTEKRVTCVITTTGSKVL